MPQIGERIVYLGIDPGANGGIVSICGGKTVATKMPKTEQEVWELISSHSHPFGDRSYAVIEKVGGFVGGEGQPGSSMFNFGRGVGVLIGSLIAARIPFVEVIPRTWQKDLGVTPKLAGETDSQWKNRLRDKAVQIFPNDETITLAVADAYLIARYCQRLYSSKKQPIPTNPKAVTL